MNDYPTEPLGFAALPDPLRARIEAELASGERLLWASQPDTKRPRGRRRTHASMWVWTGGWAALGIICVAGSIGFHGTRYEGFGGFLIFIAICAEVIAFLMLVAVVGERTSGVRKAHLDRTLYVLSDRRVIIWAPVERSPAVAVRQYPPGSVAAKEFTRLEYPDGSGDLTFGHYSGSEGLFGVADVRQVDELVRQVLNPSSPTTMPSSLYDPDHTEEPF